MKRIKWWTLFLLLILFTSIPGVSHTEAAEMKETLNAENVAAFVDVFVAEKMDAAHAPGLVITIVYQGETLLAQGYGLADLEAGRPMTAQTTVRAGSVSKPVTSAAVLQMAANGQIDLNAPVSDYLPDLPLVDGFGPAATVAQLLALQGGYADAVLQTHTPDLDKWQPLGAYLQTHLPPRTLPPGKVYSYSSWDHALLGQAMAKITHKSFDQAVGDILLRPLGMAQTTFTQPLPDPIAANLATGYTYDNGRYEEVPLDYVQLSPGIALVTTGEDMGRFMLALLNGGVVDGEQALAAETVAGMLARQEQVHPQSRGRTYGLSEITLGGRPALYQDGNGIGQANRIVLVPEHELGIFLSVNHRPLGHDATSTPANRFIQELSGALLETFLPAEAEEGALLPMLPNAGERNGRYAGHYRLAGTPQGDFFKLGALLDNVTVRANGDGTLAIGSGRYREVEPLLFQSEKDPGFFVVFVENEAGDAQWLTFGGTGSYEKVRWYETPVFQVALIAFVLIASLIFIIAMPFSGFRSWPVWLMSLLQILFLAGLAWMMLRADLILFFKTIPLTTRLLFLLPWVIGALALTLPLALTALWRQQTAVWVRFLYSLNASATVGFVWLVYYWNLYWKF